jgi:deoxyribodipyrimidine photo-lyase
MQVVWFKRDLRIKDHLPLSEAAARGPVVPLFVDEPGILLAEDQSTQHALFREECLHELAQGLAALGAPLLRRQADMLTVLDELHRLGPIETLWSHEETGNALSYQRDLAVADWCRTHRVAWIEYPQHGVIRRLASRNGWARLWDQRMHGPLVATPLRVLPALQSPSGPLLSGRSWRCFDGPCIPAGADKPGRQHGGRKAGLALLESFLAGRGQDYRRGMSSPLSATLACSRLSPYLAFGVLSIRETVHRLAQTMADLRRQVPGGADPAQPGLLAALKSFEGRLHWHCHFIQKLESQPEIEFRNVHRGFDGLREDGFDQDLFAAWCSGETGYPMVDACQRMLAATGWINFRMRAMLVSFAAYQLWLHWRLPALHLAREFLDYEPGIHYSQMQMQSGVTGINTLRIYNPVKQARDHDPRGHFVRRWIPALAAVPDDWIFEPWRMPPGLQARAGLRIGTDYPVPVVDHEVAARLARQRIGARRAEPAVRAEARAVMARHGSRKGSAVRKGANGQRTASPEHRQEGFDFGQG